GQDQRRGRGVHGRARAAGLLLPRSGEAGLRRRRRGYGWPRDDAAGRGQEARGLRAVVPEHLRPRAVGALLLQKYGRLVDDHTFRGYRERTYALPGDTTFELSPTPLASGADFDRTFQLESAGYGPSIAADPGLLGRLGQPVAASGEKLMIALRWKLLQAVTKDYKVSGYLTDAHGNLGGQVDLLLRHDQATTTHWVPGEEATDYYVLETRP